MMKYRKLGKTGFEVSEVSLGTWQVGGKWGSGFDDRLAESLLDKAIDEGINFIDTADVYENRQSEAAVGRVLRRRREKIRIATKCGRFVSPHVNEGYTPEVLRGYVERSLKNTGLETLDLIQLHCPPPQVYDRPEIFGLFDRLKEEGKILAMGVSVETVNEASKAIRYDNVTTVQIIFNMFRQKPAEEFFEKAMKRDVGIIVRVPLASGLLTGRYSMKTEFSPEDHRHFNRDGAAFDKGETFSGIPYEKGLEAVDRLKKLFPDRENLAPTAIRWILEHPQVSTVIPGASKIDQLMSNIHAVDMPSLSDEEKKGVHDVYQDEIKALVHHLW